MNLIIEIKGYSKKYSGHTVEIDNLKITKRVSLLVGKNGSGKSTLLKSIAGLVSYNGTIKLKGKVCFMNETFMFPKDIELSLFLSLLNNLSKDKRSNSFIETLLVNFELNNKLENKLDSLSKGMKAKVNIVQCLLEKGDIYLLDEPLSGLDSEGIKSFKSYIKNSDSQFIISTHLDKDLRDISDEVVYL